MTTKTSRLSILLFWGLLSLGVQAQPFSTIYVFGDSLSDRGNLAALSVAPGQAFLDILNHYPFDLGFSNPKTQTEPGQRAVEVLADALDLPLRPSLHTLLLPQGLPPQGNNFAVAGAVASGLKADGSSDQPVFLLDSQLAAFDLAVTTATSPPDLANALYVVFIGGNDVRVARDAISRKMSKRVIRTAVQNIDAAVRHVAQSGARAILVVNSPDIGSIPETRELPIGPLARLAALKATALTRSFNAELAMTLRKTQKELNLKLVQFDLFDFFHTVLTNGDGLGFADTRHACIDNPLLPVAVDDTPQCLTDFDRFVFFDEVHPTNHVHQRVGRALFALVPELPTAAP